MFKFGKSVFSGLLSLALAAGLISAVPEAAVASTYQSISFLTTGTNAQGSGKSETTDMSFLATRSQRKDLTRAGVGPYTMTHTNADPSLNYSFQTDVKYGDTTVRHSSCQSSSGIYECAAQLRESDLRANSTVNFQIESNNGTTAVLFSNGNIQQIPTGGSTTNTKDGIVTFGSIFGPDVWSAPFEASASAAVSVEWTAQGGGDDYEIYGFLVAIDGSGGCSASSDFGGTTQAQKLASHDVLIYSRGKYSRNAANTDIYFTAKGTIANEGCYRFRLVNGTYDASGGHFVGARFTARNLRVGQEQVISATPQSDLVVDSSQARTIQIQATSNAAGATITYQTIASQNSVCSVNSSGAITIG